MDKLTAEQMITEARSIFESINRLTVITMNIPDEAVRSTARRAIARIIAELDDGLVRTVRRQFPELDVL